MVIVSGGLSGCMTAPPRNACLLHKEMDPNRSHTRAARVIAHVSAATFGG
jgi:hypothetical protein